MVSPAVHYFCTRSNQDSHCDFWASVNVTDGIQNKNGSITYKNNTYPKEDIFMSTEIFEEDDSTARKKVEPHFRACVCGTSTSKPCITLCNSENNTLMKYYNSVKVDIYDSPNNFRSVDLLEHFSYRRNSCEPSISDENNKLLENGNFKNFDTGITYFHNEYCLSLTMQNDSITPIPLFCGIELDSYQYKVMPYFMFVSSLCFLFISTIHFCFPDLLKLPGKYFVCVMITFGIGEFVLSYALIFKLSSFMCIATAYISYYSILSAFFWLNIISFDFWWKMHRLISIKQTSKYDGWLSYILYGFGSPLVLTIAAVIIDRTDIHKDYKPGLGTDTCLLKEEYLSKFLYFHMFIFLIMCSNIVFFILTFLKIRRAQNNIRRQMMQDVSQTKIQKLKQQKSQFGLFLRLSIFMGVMWLLEPISLIDPDYWLFKITDAWNSSQGILFFLYFIMKVEVFKILHKHYLKWRAKADSENSSSSNVISLSDI